MSDAGSELDAARREPRIVHRCAWCADWMQPIQRDSEGLTIVRAGSRSGSPSDSRSTRHADQHASHQTISHGICAACHERLASTTRWA